MKTVCKFRGITLNYNASHLVKFDPNDDLLLNRPANGNVTVHTIKIYQTKRGEGACVSIVTEPEDKIYKISLLKRRRIDDNTSVPFGYK